MRPILPPTPISVRGRRVRSQLLRSAAGLALGLVSYGRGAYAQSCTETSPGTYNCSGYSSNSITLSGDPLDVTTGLAFEVNTYRDVALDLNNLPYGSTTSGKATQAGGDINFTDTLSGSDLRGGKYGLRARTVGEGTIHVTMYGVAQSKYPNHWSAKYPNSVSGGEAGLHTSAVDGDTTITLGGFKSRSDFPGKYPGARGYSGIYSDAKGGDINITIQDEAVAEGRGGSGIFAGSDNGNVMVSVRDQASVIGQNDGIRGYSQFGDVTVTVEGDGLHAPRVSGSDDDGIDAEVGYYSGGSVSVSISGGSTITGNDNGIDASAGRDSVIGVSVSGSSEVSGGRNGISAETRDRGLTSVTVGGDSRVRGGNRGIFGYSIGSDNLIDIAVKGSAEVYGGDAGIFAYSKGFGGNGDINVTVQDDAVVGRRMFNEGKDVERSETGIDAYTRYGNIRIRVQDNALVDSGHKYGISARSRSGAVDIDIADTSTVTGTVGAFGSTVAVDIAAGATVGNVFGSSSFGGRGGSIMASQAMSEGAAVAITNAGDILGTPEDSPRYGPAGDAGILGMTDTGSIQIRNTGTVAGREVGIGALSGVDKYGRMAPSSASGAIDIAVAAGSVMGGVDEGGYGIAATSFFSSKTGGGEVAPFATATPGPIRITVSGEASGAPTVVRGSGLAIRASVEDKHTGGDYASTQGFVSIDLDGNVEIDGGIEVAARQTKVHVGRGVSVTGDIVNLKDGEATDSYSRMIVSNFGEVTGDIQMSSGSDVMIQGTGATVSGLVDGGASSAAGGDGSFNYNGFGATIQLQDALAFVQGGSFGGARYGAYGATERSRIDLSTVDFDGVVDADDKFINFESFAVVGEDVILAGTTGDAGLLFVEGGAVIEGVARNLDLQVSNRFGSNRGFIGGTGTIGSLMGDLMIAPGDRGRGATGRIGTLSVVGDVDLTGQSNGAASPFGAGAAVAAQAVRPGLLKVDIAADGRSDLLKVGGEARIGGAALEVNSQDAFEDFPDENLFRIITADGGVSGKFGTIDDNVTDLMLEAIYKDESVELAWVLEKNEEDLSDKTVFGAASGAGLVTSRVFNSNLRERGQMPDAQDGAPRSDVISTSGLNNALVAPPVAAPAASTVPASPLGYTVFGEILGERLKVDADTNPGYEADSHGVMLGIEAEQSMAQGQLRFGAAGSYIEGNATTGAGRAEVDSRGIGGFAGFAAGPLTVSSALSYSDLSFDTFRELGAFDGTGSTDGHAIAGSMEVAYDVAPKLGYAGMSLSPYASLQAVHVEYDGFAEDGTTLAVEGNELDTQYLELGARYATTVVQNDLVLHPNLSLGLEHAMGDLSTTTVSNVGVGGDLITETAEIDRNRLKVGAGVSFGDVAGLQGHISYEGAFGEDSRGHTGSFGISMAF